MCLSRGECMKWVALLVVLVLLVPRTSLPNQKSTSQNNRHQKQSDRPRMHSFMELFTKLERDWMGARQRKDQTRRRTGLAPEFNPTRLLGPGPSRRSCQLDPGCAYEPSDTLLWLPCHDDPCVSRCGHSELRTIRTSEQATISGRKQQHRLIDRRHLGGKSWQMAGSGKVRRSGGETIGSVLARGS